MPPRVLASGPKPCAGNNLWIFPLARESLPCQSRVARQSLSNFACKLNSKVWFRRRASAVFLSKFISEFSPARQKHDVISSGGELTDMPETEPNHSVVLFTDNAWEKSAILYTHFKERKIFSVSSTYITPCRLPDLNIRELKYLLPSSFHRHFQRKGTHKDNFRGFATPLR